MNRNILITGGAGFIGCHLVKYFVKKYPNYNIINLDLLTYAGNLSNLNFQNNNKNYHFVEGDICDSNFLNQIFNKYQITDVIHLAAESHVDRSLEDPSVFAKTNVIGTLNLLNQSLKSWKNKSNNVFYHVSTDEVYGSLEETGFFTEETSYDPRSPYSASKASSDHFVRSFFHTYALNTLISNCSNNYGPNQHPEKLIPKTIINVLNSRKIPIYGKGINVRDWLYVEDHVEAIDIIFHNGKYGETYNIGGSNEWKNIDIVNLIIKLIDKKNNLKNGNSSKLIEFVKDRLGHDKRYAIDSSKIKNNLGWKPKTNFESGLEKTIDWYFSNNKWIKVVLNKL